MIPLNRAQREGLSWMLDKPRVIYAAGAGLGKTRATITDFLTQRLVGVAHKMFVLAPKQASLLSWPSEIERWAPELKVSLLAKTWKWDDSDVYVLNYEHVPRLLKLIQSTKTWPCNYMVLDEVTCARNPSAQRMVSLRPLLRRADYVRGLTGTPRPNSDTELFGMMKHICQESSPLGQVKYRFENTYFDKDYMGWNLTPKPGAVEKIREKLKDHMMCQRSSEYLDLPDITYVDVPISFSNELMRDYKSLKKDLFLELENGEVNAVSAGVLVNKLLQFTSGRIFENVPNPSNPDKPKRVTHHIHDLKTEAVLGIKARPLLVMRNFTHTEIPGAVHLDETNVPDWNQQRIPLGIGHPAGIGIGVNLQAGGCDLCWHTPTYSPLNVTQAEARLWRTGQEEPVTVYRIIANDTVDEAVWLSVEDKEAEQDSLMRSLSFLKQM